jgi:site-specific DNA-methyltransferase (adenine-specific)
MKMPISEVYNMDCMEYMKTIPDGFFDLAICDPPYFSGPEKKQYYGSKVSNKNIKRIDYVPLDKSWKVPTKEYFDELLRVSKHQIIWGINYYKVVLPKNGIIIWDKINDTSTFSDAELAYCSMINTVKIFRYMWNGMLQGCGDGTSFKIQGNKKLNEKKIHPTQKPIVLYRWLLKNFSKTGDKIFDSHLGSGSSRIATNEMGFDFYGCELDTNYFNAANKRFNDYKNQTTLF